MKHSLKQIFPSLTGLVLFIVILSIPLATQPVHALSAVQLDKAATQACKSKSSKKDSHKNSARSACETGYKAGYKEDGKDKTCKNFKSHKDDCRSGYDKGKKAASDKAAKAKKDSNTTGACGADYCPDEAASKSCNQDACDLISLYLNPAISVLSGVVALVVTGSIIMGGIQYSASEGDPQKAAKAKNRISNAIFALIAYLFLYAFLQFLVPGGVFNR